MIRIIKSATAFLMIVMLCSSCQAAPGNEPEPSQSEQYSQVSSGNESNVAPIIEFESSSDECESETGESSARPKKEYQTLQDVVDELSEQMKENKIKKDVKSLYIPKLFVGTETQFSNMTPTVGKFETADMSVQIFFKDLDEQPVSVAKYNIFMSRITYFEQPQDITEIKSLKETMENTEIYHYDGKDFAFMCVKASDTDDRYVFNIIFFINEKTHVYILGMTKDNKDIDTEEKAIAVFKDFSCITIGEALQ